MKCWGDNGDGELGDGTQLTRTTPVSVCSSGSGAGCTAFTGASKLSAGIGHTCVITTTNGVSCWGSQAFGQLGNGVTSFTDLALRPVGWTLPGWAQVPTPTPTPQPPQATALSAGGLHTCTIISSFVECWGWNSFGQVGNGTTADTNTWVGQDVDKDGCTDAQELGPTPAAGGQRDPTNFWDFFDTPDTTNTTLSTAVTAAATPPFDVTVPANGTGAFPASADSFYIDNEKFSWDTKTSTTFHVTRRALDGTTLAQHNLGAFVVRNVRDKQVDSSDVSRVQARFYTNGSTSIDPLSPPPPTGYHTAFDRTSGSPYSWSTGAPDGMIRVDDILAASHQSGHSCQ